MKIFSVLCFLIPSILVAQDAAQLSFKENVEQTWVLKEQLDKGPNAEDEVGDYERFLPEFVYVKDVLVTKSETGIHLTLTGAPSALNPVTWKIVRDDSYSQGSETLELPLLDRTFVANQINPTKADPTETRIQSGLELVISWDATMSAVTIDSICGHIAVNGEDRYDFEYQPSRYAAELSLRNSTNARTYNVSHVPQDGFLNDRYIRITILFADQAQGATIKGTFDHAVGWGACNPLHWIDGSPNSKRMQAIKYLTAAPCFHNSSASVYVTIDVPAGTKFPIFGSTLTKIIGVPYECRDENIQVMVLELYDSKGLVMFKWPESGVLAPEWVRK